LKNISLKQYYEKPTALYTGLFSALKPKNGFAGQLLNVNAMPYINTRHCLKLLQRPTLEAAKELFDVCYGYAVKPNILERLKRQEPEKIEIPDKVFWNAPAIEYFQAKAFIIQEFTILAEQEQKLFASKSEDEDLWRRAGSDRLKPMSDILPLVNLGKLFSAYPFDLGRKPYGEVLNLLVAVKTQSEVEQDFYKLKNS